MTDFALNHMTVANVGYRRLFEIAKAAGCAGVELRNDLKTPLFDGDDAATVRDAAAKAGLRIVGLSQVYPFNAWSDAIRAEVQALIANAVAVGAETISLIPLNDGRMTGDEGRDMAKVALREIKPLLDAADMVALVEPLGFKRSSLRSKAETVEIIESLGAAGRYKLVHDTFHHHLAGGGPFFPEHTGIIHISGVVDPRLAVSEMEDEHRILVDDRDRLGNVEQIAALRDAGYAGPISFEAFSPDVHNLANPEAALRASIAFIRNGLAGDPA